MKLERCFNGFTIIEDGYLYAYNTETVVQRENVFRCYLGFRVDDPNDTLELTFKPNPMQNFNCISNTVYCNTLDNNRLYVLIEASSTIADGVLLGYISFPSSTVFGSTKIGFIDSQQWFDLADSLVHNELSDWKASTISSDWFTHSPLRVFLDLTRRGILKLDIEADNVKDRNSLLSNETFAFCMKEIDLFRINRLDKLLSEYIRSV